ncbi:uncharacterized protein SCHCODRAFT_02630148 [Schizophyllum commune H4-8]|uniref:Mid2 domain-containing protein n=1 Tax=Schizophyllum commune (strain H4-8 / FGSC 9210) TaxID=578458 RepID=D8Q6Q1_SCHCM|nr:uncharacterized protein SCHCODRAFT_02630148 [Schizophyllum commune H4-8]KAI5891833.1 hypothetical protein SCHCODRAFT_02630148 [Schizophyllum commune H4-8]
MSSTSSTYSSTPESESPGASSTATSMSDSFSSSPSDTSTSMDSTTSASSFDTTSSTSYDPSTSADPSSSSSISAPPTSTTSSTFSESTTASAPPSTTTQSDSTSQPPDTTTSNPPSSSTTQDSTTTTDPPSSSTTASQPPNSETSTTENTSRSSTGDASPTSRTETSSEAPVTTVIQTTIVQASNGELHTSLATITSTADTALGTGSGSSGSSSNGSGGSKSHTGAIVGGVVGGVVGLALLGLLGLWAFRRYRKQKRLEDFFDGNFDPDRVVAGGTEKKKGRKGPGGTLPDVQLDEEEAGGARLGGATMTDNGAGVVTPYAYTSEPQGSQYGTSSDHSGAALIGGAARSHSSASGGSQDYNRQSVPFALQPGHQPGAPGFPQPEVAGATGVAYSTNDHSAHPASEAGRSSSSGGVWGAHAPARRMSAGGASGYAGPGYIMSNKERERLSVANPGPSDVFVHQDAGEVTSGEIPPTYDSIRRD